MIFSIGDLITLVVVLLILVIFRAMDRNNRSLEKLKRFSDKIAENLSATVAQKTTEVRDLSLELQASLKTGREILVRARGVEEMLQGRSSDIEEIQARFTEYDKALEELTGMSARVDKNLARIKDESEFVDGMGRRLEEAAKKLRDVEQRIPMIQEDFSARIGSAIESARGELASVAGSARDELAAGIDAARAELRAGVEAATGDLATAVQTTRGELAAGVESRVAGIAEQLSQSEARVKDFSAYLARLEAREEQAERERLEGLNKALGDLEASLRGKLAAAARQGESLENEVFARLSSRIQEDEASISRSIQTLETRLSDYQGDVEYRIKSLEESGADIEGLRKSLYQAMEKMTTTVRSEMKALGAELTAGWTAEIASASSAREQLRTGMAELEQGLAELKNRAYQDVESKLAVFEDEFFASLRERSSAMQEKVKVWQADLEGRVSTFESEVKERLGSADEAIQGLRETLRVEADKARKEAAGSFDKELAAVRESLDAGTRRMQRDIEAGLKTLSVEMESGRKELTDLFEASRAEVATWEVSARQALADTKLSIAEKISSLSGDAAASILAIKEGFASQREDLLVSTNEERTALRAELSQMAESIAAFRTEMDRSTDAGLETLRGQLDSFQLESQKRLRDLQAEVDGRIREHKQQFADAREKTEAMQEKLFGKVDESSRLLAGNLAEIDKRVKNFLAQTRLFERADGLKATLEGTLDEMKKDMARLEGDRGEIAEIEQQLARTRKLAEEVSGKLTRFLSEKRRIEEMEGEFKKVVALSKDVDLKIDTLSSSNDALQQIQAKIRQFEEMGKAVESGFERLEKKREILTITSEGVDRNFQRLEGIEKNLQEADRAADDLSAKVRDLTGEYDLLASNKKDAEAAMELVGKLNGIMGELETRLEKAQSSREWMARTETRFEEIGRQAQEQVRLLESIIKAETRKEKPGPGAPPLDKRETVVKLSHQGWSVQEISRVTQLSRGEVELILELAPKV